MKALIICSNPNVVESLSLCLKLRWSSAITIHAIDGHEGLRAVELEQPDLVILDLEQPQKNGFEVLTSIRQFCEVPIIILTPRDDAMARVKGLEMGADEYISNPLTPQELLDVLAKVKALLRRSRVAGFEGNGHDSFVSDKLTINFTTFQVLISGEPVKFTPTEYSLLRALVKSQGRVLTHRHLLEQVWGHEYQEDNDFLKKYVYRLRKKMGDDTKEPSLIQTVRGVGYRFVKTQQSAS